MGKLLSPMALLAVLAATGARANLVPVRTEAELLESAELVVDARIVAARIRVNLPPRRLFTDEKGDLHLTTRVREPCARAKVERRLKGRSGGTIILCSSVFAESAPLPRQGQFVRLYLEQDGPVWCQLHGSSFRVLAKGAKRR